MNSTNKTVTAPKHFRASSIIHFINDCSGIYDRAGKKEGRFYLDLSKIKACSLIGILLIYKIIEFTVKNDCFSTYMYGPGKGFNEAMKKYGFAKLIHAYIADKKASEQELANLKISVTDHFFIAPQALLRSDKYTSEILNAKYLPQIDKYYSFSPKAVSMILTCFSEIFLNFWEHAVDDTQSIIVANGNKTNIEISCADNGKGIISSLTLAGKGKNSNIGTLLSAVEKGVTSKELSNHMGYGLWIVDEIISRTVGRFHLYSEGYYYQRDFGKVKSGKCGHWQGTVVYISIPTRSAVTLSDIEKPESDENFNLQINWA